MAWIKTFKNSDGGYDSFDWSLSKAVQFEALSLLMIVMGASIFCTLGSALCLFIYPLPGSRQSSKSSLLAGVFFTIIWMIDYSWGIFNWVFWSGMPEVYTSVTAINFTLLIVCLICFIFEDILNDTLTSVRMPLLLFYGGIIFFTYKFYPMMYDIISNVLTISETHILS